MNKATTRLGCPDRRRDMQAGGVADEGDLWLLGQSLFEVREDEQVVFFFQVCPFLDLELVGENRRIGAGIIRDDFHIIPQQHPQVTQVALSDPAETHDKDFHLASSSQSKVFMPSRNASKRIRGSALPRPLHLRWRRVPPAG